MRKAMAFFLMAGAASAASAQESSGQLWTTTTVTAPLSERVDLSGHAVVRFSDEDEGVSQVQLGADLEAEVGGVKAGGGYSYVTDYDGGDLATREHRLRQQVSGDMGSLGSGTLAGRIRVEQRWRDDGEDMMVRLRPRMSWTRPIGANDLALRLIHESFVRLNDTDWGGEARYERMRNQVSLRRTFGDTLTGEAGYLNQYSFGGDEPDEVVHALTLALTIDF
jgi:hypothetical protein